MPTWPDGVGYQVQGPSSASRGGTATLSFTAMPAPASITATATYLGGATQNLGAKVGAYSGACGCYQATFTWTVPANAGVGPASVGWHLVYQAYVHDSSWPFAVT
jgi:hypothetical protein